MSKYFSYVLKSAVNGDIYVDSTQDVNQRLRCHNQGKVRSTKAYRPWKLLEFHPHLTRSAAVRYERFLKQHRQKIILREKYKHI